MLLIGWFSTTTEQCYFPFEEAAASQSSGVDFLTMCRAVWLKASSQV